MTESVITLNLEEPEKTKLFHVLMDLPVENRTYQSAIKKLLAIREELIQDIQSNVRKANRLQPLVRSFISDNKEKIFLMILWLVYLLI